MPSLRRLIALLSLLSLPVALVVLSGGTASARVAKTTSTVKTTSAVKSTHTIKSTSLGTGSPTFTGPAATGCTSPGCSLLSGPFPTPSTAGLSASSPAVAAGAAAAKKLAADTYHAMPSPGGGSAGVTAGVKASVRASAGADLGDAGPHGQLPAAGPGL